MSSEWHSCLKELKRLHPDKSPLELNQIRNTIWSDANLKQKWLAYSQYQAFQQLKSNPSVQKDPGFDVNSIPVAAPSVNKPGRKKQVQIKSDSSDDDVPVSKNKAPVKKSVVKDANYYKLKCKRLQAERAAAE